MLHWKLQVGKCNFVEIPTGVPITIKTFIFFTDSKVEPKKIEIICNYLHIITIFRQDSKKKNWKCGDNNNGSNSKRYSLCYFCRNTNTLLKYICFLFLQKIWVIEETHASWPDSDNIAQKVVRQVSEFLVFPYLRKIYILMLQNASMFNLTWNYIKNCQSWHKH